MRLPHNRGGFRTYLIVLGLLTFQANVLSIVIGGLFMATGVVIRLWAKGCLHQDREVTTSGPYRFVRHPFYSGTIVADFGIAVMSGSFVLMFAMPLLWLAVYLPEMRREEAALRMAFGGKYDEYAKRVPLLVPFRSPLPWTPGFSWSNWNLAGTELARTVRFLSYPLLFVMSFHVQEHGITADSLMMPTFAYSALGVILLSGIAWQLKRSLGRGRTILPEWISTPYMRVLMFLAMAFVAAVVTRFEMEADWLAVPSGLLLMALPLLVSRWKQLGGLVSWAMLSIGFAMLCEVPWLAFPVILACSALYLDEQRPNVLAVGRLVTPLQNGASAGLYRVAFVGLVAIAVLKEFAA